MSNLSGSMKATLAACCNFSWKCDDCTASSGGDGSVPTLGWGFLWVSCICNALESLQSITGY